MNAPVRRGRFFVLPIEGRRLRAVAFDGLLTLHVNDEAGSWLEVHGPFVVEQHNHSRTLSPRDHEALLFWADLIGQMFSEARADQHGQLFLVLPQVHITVEDGPYENWHFTRPNPHGIALHMHGGVGQTWW